MKKILTSLSVVVLSGFVMSNVAGMRNNDPGREFVKKLSEACDTVMFSQVAEEPEISTSCDLLYNLVIRLLGQEAPQAETALIERVLGQNSKDPLKVFVDVVQHIKAFATPVYIDKVQQMNAFTTLARVLQGRGSDTIAALFGVNKWKFHILVDRAGYNGGVNECVGALRNADLIESLDLQRGEEISEEEFSNLKQGLEPPIPAPAVAVAPAQAARPQMRLGVNDALRGVTMDQLEREWNNVLFGKEASADAIQHLYGLVQAHISKEQHQLIQDIFAGNKEKLQCLLVTANKLRGGVRCKVDDCNTLEVLTVLARILRGQNLLVDGWGFNRWSFDFSVKQGIRPEHYVTCIHALCESGLIGGLRLNIPSNLDKKTRKLFIGLRLTGRFGNILIAGDPEHKSRLPDWWEESILGIEHCKSLVFQNIILPHMPLLRAPHGEPENGNNRIERIDFHQTELQQYGEGRRGRFEIYSFFRNLPINSFVSPHLMNEEELKAVAGNLPSTVKRLTLRGDDTVDAKTMAEICVSIILKCPQIETVNAFCGGAMNLGALAEDFKQQLACCVVKSSNLKSFIIKTDDAEKDMLDCLQYGKSPERRLINFIMRDREYVDQVTNKFTDTCVKDGHSIIDAYNGNENGYEGSKGQLITSLSPYLDETVINKILGSKNIVSAKNALKTTLPIFMKMVGEVRLLDRLGRYAPFVTRFMKIFEESVEKVEKWPAAVQEVNVDYIPGVSDSEQVARQVFEGFVASQAAKTGELFLAQINECLVKIIPVFREMVATECEFLNKYSVDQIRREMAALWRKLGQRLEYAKNKQAKIEIATEMRERATAKGDELDGERRKVQAKIVQLVKERLNIYLESQLGLFEETFEVVLPKARRQLVKDVFSGRLRDAITAITTVSGEDVADQWNDDLKNNSFEALFEPVRIANEAKGTVELADEERSFVENALPTIGTDDKFGDKFLAFRGASGKGEVLKLFKDSRIRFEDNAGVSKGDGGKVGKENMKVKFNGEEMEISGEDIPRLDAVRGQLQQDLSELNSRLKSLFSGVAEQFCENIGVTARESEGMCYEMFAKICEIEDRCNSEDDVSMEVEQPKDDQDDDESGMPVKKKPRTGEN